MGTIEDGAFQALRNCLNLGKDEKIVIISDVETLEIGTAFVIEAKKWTSKIKFFILEDFGERPLKKLPKTLKQAVRESDVGIYAAQGKQDELQGFRRPLLQECDKSRIRFANMVNINQEMMGQSMCADYKRLQSFSDKLFRILTEAEKIHVTTKAGTDFTAEFSQDIRWIKGDGIIKEDHWSNLPDGEIYTCPKTVNGRVVVDGVLGDYFAAKYGVVAKNPVVIDIKTGNAIRIRCSDQELEHELKDYMNTDENARKVGEFALGTNLEIKELMGKLLQDEKFPGVHIAFGSGYPERTGCPWKSGVHLDAVLRWPTVTVDGKKIMQEGEYLI